MKNVALLTVGRSDYGMLVPVYHALRERDVNATFYVGGTHTDPRYGGSVSEILQDGVEISAIWNQPQVNDPLDYAHAFGLMMENVTAQLTGARPPDGLVLLGDRWEMLAAAVAALPCRVPVVHLHGGEVTRGVIDNQLRAALTKVAHLHCVAMDAHARGVVALGEEAWRIHVTGSPALDRIQALWPPPKREHLALVLYHAETLSAPDYGERVRLLYDAVRAWDRTIRILTLYPGADVGHRRIIENLSDDAVTSLTHDEFLRTLYRARVMIGNSSAGLIEAPWAALPVVNVGDRQAGRLRGANVLDAEWNAESLQKALERADSLSLAYGTSPYGDGHAAPQIADVITQPYDRDTLIRK